MSRRSAWAAAVAIVATACGGSPPAPTVAATDAIGAIAAGADCGEVVRPRLQSGNHLLGDAQPPVPYSSNPPTSGWHASGMPPQGVQDEPLSGPQLVSALEVGQVVLAWDPAATDAATVERLAELATTTFAGRVTVTAWTPMPSALALVGWGVLQRCNQLDDDVVADFVITHYGASQDHA